MNGWRVGDAVIYHKPKHSTNPSPRAKERRPMEHGDDYSYIIDKYWTVAEVRDDGMIVVTTRRGKRHEIRTDDPLLRRANWLERIFLRSRFPRHTATTLETGQQQSSV